LLLSAVLAERIESTDGGERPAAAAAAPQRAAAARRSAANAGSATLSAEARR